MSVQNIECQIAQAQISRLLAEEPLGQAIMADLEVHVAACPDCQSFIMGRNRSLDVVVGGAEKPVKPKKQPKPKPEPTIESEEIQSLKEERLAFEKLFNPKTPKAAVETKRESTTASTFWKPLAYSGALAAVLFAMSFVMKNPTAIFGDRAIAAETAQPKTTDSNRTDNTTSNAPAAETTPPSAAEQTDSTTPAEEPDESLTVRFVSATADAEPIAREDVNTVEPQDQTPTEPGALVMARPKPAAVETPAPVKPKPAIKAKPKPKVTVRQYHPTRHRKPSRLGARKPRTSVRFYDSEGRPL